MLASRSSTSSPTRSPALASRWAHWSSPSRVWNSSPAGSNSPQCLGGEQASATVRLILDSLRREARIGELPMSVGPQAQLGEARPVPQGVSDPAAWIKENVLPRRPQREDELGETAPLGAQRATAGYRFFETWHVSQWVKKRYLPPELTGWSRPHVAPDISHYVSGASRVLLMEPLVTTREAFEKDLEQVGRAFLGWRGLQRYVTLPQEPTLITYVHGGSQNAVMEAKRALQPYQPSHRHAAACRLRYDNGHGSSSPR